MTCGSCCFAKVIPRAPRILSNRQPGWNGNRRGQRRNQAADVQLNILFSTGSRVRELLVRTSTINNRRSKRTRAIDCHCRVLTRVPVHGMLVPWQSAKQRQCQWRTSLYGETNARTGRVDRSPQRLFACLLDSGTAVLKGSLRGSESPHSRRSNEQLIFGCSSCSTQRR